MLEGKSVILGVCGGIAAYKAAALCSKLTQAGAKVRVVMTESGAKLVQPLTFQALSRNHVIVDAFEENDPAVVTHVDIADKADLVIIAPATANIIAKMACGLADDMLSTTMLVSRAPVLMAPAMNVHMYEHPAVQENLRTLEKRGVQMVEPGTGQLACGYVGKGRMAEPEQIIEAAFSLLRTRAAQSLAAQPLAGKKVLVTAGGTVERIDPARYLSNDSSGKMGFAIAEAARDMGAEVTVVAARISVPVPAGVAVVQADSALEMMDQVLSRLEGADVVVKAAAVADYRPVQQAEHKIKKHGETLTLELVRNPDILQEIGKRRTNQFVVGFAAESEDVEVNAREKLQRKGCDLLVANQINVAGSGFGTDSNQITIYGNGDFKLALPLLTKQEAALQLMQLVADRMAASSGLAAAGAEAGWEGESLQDEVRQQ